MRNVPCAQLTMCKNLTVETDFYSLPTKMHRVDVSSTFIAKCKFSILWNGWAFVIIKIVLCQKNTCNKPFYTLLEYCTARRKRKKRKKKLNNKWKTKLHNQKCLT